MELFSAYPLHWILGLIAALIVTGMIAGVMAGLLGVGGGIVIVPVLFHLFSLLGVDEAVRMHQAVGTSLATIIPTSIMSARAHYAKGNLDPAILKRLLPGVIIGVIIGGLLSNLFSGAVLMGLFATVAFLVALNMFRRQSTVLGTGLPGPLGSGALGTFIGGVSTLMGIGGGTLSVPTLSTLGTPMHLAVGTGAALGLVISLPGTASFLLNGIGEPNLLPGSIGYVNLLGFAAIVPATMLCAPVGAKLAHAMDAAKLKKVFAIFLMFTALRMFYDLFTGS
ncbi:sulfite exporter TauE/SafE family protein [Cobetia sp. MC34]|uniref:sulfite exporter TauE/SafE family protein n=2 Tax=Cobetia TaxID=204286 RepID=UPI00103D1498|nr:sulfite exporter TauE/SafE family protein [Cobetia sp. MC34]MBS4153177.1 sulfite exporter TauE/SafE family protein [Cobetia sp. MC34]TCJ25964.1 sulfite exporter TauE/SafE family protein [Halomonas sp. GDM18]